MWGDGSREEEQGAGRKQSGAGVSEKPSPQKAGCWKLPGLGTTHCPPWKEQKGKGRAFVGSQGSGCLLPHLLDALPQPAFYRCLASPIVTAPQEGSSQEALNNFNFQKVGKKEQRGRAREEGRRKRFKTICGQEQNRQGRQSGLTGGRQNFPFKGRKKRRGWERAFKSLVNL